MIVAFFESMKYVGHLFPMAFLRVFVGYYYLNQALVKYNGDFLTHPKVAEAISLGLAQSVVPDWYQTFLLNTAVPYWKVFAAVIVVLEFVVGISYLFGYLVRPAAVIGIILSLFYISIYQDMDVFHKTFIAIHITLAWLGAGRCLGFDYYFYKRNRGIWW